MVGCYGSAWGRGWGCASAARFPSPGGTDAPRAGVGAPSFRGRWRDEGSVSIAVFPYDALAIRHPQRPRAVVTDGGVKTGGEGPCSTLLLPLRWSWLGTSPRNPGATGAPAPPHRGRVGYLKSEGRVVALQKGVGYLWGPSPVGKGGSSLFGLKGKARFAFSPPL